MNSEALQEKVMVVESSKLFDNGCWEGLRDNNLNEFIALITSQYSFQKREFAEFDPSYQQIIPYLVFHCGDYFFVIKKLIGSAETRLHHNYMMGVGGHISEEDDGADILERGIQREWEEEVHYDGSYTKKLIGVLNDNSTEVSSVHIGLIYLVEGDSMNIQTAEPEQMSGSLVHRDDLYKYIEGMDSWGKIVVRWLAQGKPVVNGIFR